MTDSQEVAEIKAKLILDLVTAHIIVCDALLEQLKSKQPSEAVNLTIHRLRTRTMFLHDIRREQEKILPKDYQLPEAVTDLAPKKAKTGVNVK